MIQQRIIKFPAGEQRVLPHNMDTRAARNESGACVKNNVVIVGVREMGKRTDHVVFHAAETVSGHKKQDAHRFVRHDAPHNAGAQPLFFRQMINDGAVLHGDNAVAVRTQKDPAVRELTDREDLRASQAVPVRDRDRFFFADQGKTGIPARRDAAVRQLRADIGRIADAVCFTVALDFSVRREADQTFPAAADPEISCGVRPNAFYGGPGKMLHQCAFDHASVGQPNGAEAVICSYIQYPVPDAGRICRIRC